MGLDTKSEKEIVKTLMSLSERLSDIKEHSKKMELLKKFDVFLKKNEMIIKEKCPDLLVSILNSL